MKKIICKLLGHKFGLTVKGLEHDPKIAYAFYLYQDHRVCRRCGQWQVIL